MTIFTLQTQDNINITYVLSDRTLKNPLCISFHPFPETITHYFPMVKDHAPLMKIANVTFDLTKAIAAICKNHDIPGFHHSDGSLQDPNNPNYLLSFKSEQFIKSPEALSEILEVLAISLSKETAESVQKILTTTLDYQVRIDKFLTHGNVRLDNAAEFALITQPQGLEYLETQLTKMAEKELSDVKEEKTEQIKCQTPLLVQFYCRVVNRVTTREGKKRIEDSIIASINARTDASQFDATLETKLWDSFILDHGYKYIPRGVLLSIRTEFQDTLVNCIRNKISLLIKQSSSNTLASDIPQLANLIQNSAVVFAYESHKVLPQSYLEIADQCLLAKQYSMALQFYKRVLTDLCLDKVHAYAATQCANILMRLPEALEELKKNRAYSITVLGKEIDLTETALCAEALRYTVKAHHFARTVQPAPLSERQRNHESCIDNIIPLQKSIISRLVADKYYQLKMLLTSDNMEQTIKSLLKLREENIEISRVRDKNSRAALMKIGSTLLGSSVNNTKAHDDSVVESDYVIIVTPATKAGIPSC